MVIYPGKKNHMLTWKCVIAVLEFKAGLKIFEGDRGEGIDESGGDGDGDFI